MFECVWVENVEVVVFFMYVDLIVGNRNLGLCIEDKFIKCNVFVFIILYLIFGVECFEKFVFVMYGDILFYCWDRMFGGEDVFNFWCFNVVGDFVLIDVLCVMV